MAEHPFASIESGFFTITSANVCISKIEHDPVVEDLTQNGHNKVGSAALFEAARPPGTSAVPARNQFGDRIGSGAPLVDVAREVEAGRILRRPAVPGLHNRLIGVDQHPVTIEK